MGPKPAASADSNKRKGASPANNGRGDALAHKRAKVFAARSIPTQPAETALKDGELDLAAFVAAHEFEIRALEQSMATTKAVSSSRAFQMVPRGLRRRTASHNPKRVPKRLRARARREMEEDNAPLVESRRRKPRTLRAKIRAQTRRRLHVLAARRRSQVEAKKKKKKEEEETGKDKDKDAAVPQRRARPKIRRNMLNEPPKPPARFRKRQINKTWLPTHRWHAKRARMTDPKNPLWRFAIPLTPNEKIYRPTHRAQGERGALVWDMSYMSTIGLYGTPAGMRRVLERIGLSHESCWNDRGSKWRQGTRAWTGFLSSEEKDGVRRRMCPSIVLWNPEATSTEAMDEQDAKGKKAQRQAYIRVHPSAFLQVFNELLRLTKMENPRVYIEDLRFEIGSIELTGPASTEALIAVLKPYPSGKQARCKHAELFRSLRGLSNPAALPANAVLHFNIQDPRLRYPPRRVDQPQGAEAHMSLMEAIAQWPAEEDLQPSRLFDRDARHAASCLPSQKAINRRRSTASAGTLLKPDALRDPPIPISLVAARAGAAQSQGTWTLLAPWGCILPLWYSLVHTPLSSGGNPRFAGLRESTQVSFERGLASFPVDFPGTQAGAEWELEQRRKRRWEWSRRPKSKRTEWKVLDLGAGRKGEIGDGLANDFDFLFGLKSEDAMDIDTGTKPSLHQLVDVPKSSASSNPPSYAVLCVRISVLGRGVPLPCARIYRLPTPHPSLPTDLRAQWLARRSRPKAPKETDMDTRKRLLAGELTAPPPPDGAPLSQVNRVDIDGAHPLVPDAQDLIGFVTTGNFCLADGRGSAVGSIAVEKVDGKGEGRLCIVRNAGENVGWLAKWEAI